MTQPNDAPRPLRALLHFARGGLPALLSAAALSNCAGTEADNPFTEPVETSPCKSHEEYGAFNSLDSLRAILPNPPPLSPARSLLSSDGEPDPSLAFARAGAGLSALSELPLWLQCAEWNAIDEVLSIQVTNFEGGCAVDWAGGAEFSAGQLFMSLSNPSDSVAGCGMCLYDARSSLPLSASEEDLVLNFSSQSTAEDKARELQWTLRLSERSNGMVCKPQTNTWALIAAYSQPYINAKQKALYAPCGDNKLVASAELSGECAAGLTCADDHCVPACETDNDCPLKGALVCTDGACLLRD